MKSYGISGLGADERVFQYLSLDYEIIPLKWIQPKKGEKLEAYACRLAEKIDRNEVFILMGVSFGDFVATEMSKILNPSLTILISSVEVRGDLRRSSVIFDEVT